MVRYHGKISGKFSIDCRVFIGNSLPNPRKSVCEIHSRTLKPTGKHMKTIEVTGKCSRTGKKLTKVFEGESKDSIWRKPENYGFRKLYSVT